MRSLTPNNPNPVCDCGEPATHFDASGWSCSACVSWVKHIRSEIERCILIQRGLMFDRNAGGYVEHRELRLLKQRQCMARLRKAA